MKLMCIAEMHCRMLTGEYGVHIIYLLINSDIKTKSVKILFVSDYNRKCVFRCCMRFKVSLSINTLRGLFKVQFRYRYACKIAFHLFISLCCLTFLLKLTFHIFNGVVATPSRMDSKTKFYQKATQVFYSALLNSSVVPRSLDWSLPTTRFTSLSSVPNEHLPSPTSSSPLMTNRW